MNSKLPYLFLAITLACLNACKPDPFRECFTSTGPTVEEKRTLATHPHTIEIKENIDVTWHESDSSYLQIQCGRNLKKNIITELSDGYLTIRNRNSCNWVRSYKRPVHVDLYCKTPGRLLMNGFGTFISADTMILERMQLHQYGSGANRLLIKSAYLSTDFNCLGELFLTGIASKAFYYTQDAGKLHAENMKVNVLEVKIEGDNELVVQATDTLKGVMLTPVTMYYKSRPYQKVDIIKGGKILPMPE